MSSLFAYAPRNDAERGFYEYLQASAPYLSEVVLDFVNVLFEMPYKWTMVDVQPMTPEQDGCLLNLERDELLEHVRNGLEKVDLESVIIGQASNTNIGERVVGKTRSEILQAWNQIENSCKTNPFGEGPKTEIDHDHLSIVSHTCNGGDSWNEPRHPSGAQWDYGEFDEDPRNIRFYLTATQAGYVTLPHYDPPLGISHMWHIIGAKLWLVWEDSILNMQKIRETRKKKKSSRKISLLWAINNLSGLKVYFLRPKSDKNRYLHFTMETGAVHAVVCLQSSVHLSAYLLTPEVKEEVKELTRLIIRRDDRDRGTEDWRHERRDVNETRRIWKKYMERQSMRVTDQDKKWFRNL